MSTNRDQKYPRGDPLREHELSKKLVKNGKPVDYLKIKGYVGKSDSADIVRLYLNIEFSHYLDIKKNDILHAEEIPTGDLEFGGTCIWVKKDAELIEVKMESKKQQARFMEGEIARAQLRPEYAQKDIGGIARVPQSRLFICPTRDTVKCGSLFAPVCASDFAPCTIEWFCQVITAVGPECFTLFGPECVTPVCPSVKCNSPGFVC